MMKWLSLLILTGCMANDSLRTASMSQDNIWNLSRICIGMNESQVLQIMHYPYSKKTIEHGENVYKIWFYVTRPSGLDQSRLVHQNLTPLTFENGILQGWGYEFYHHVLKQLEASKPTPKSTEEPKSHHDKDSLEKAIEGIETTSKNEDLPKNQKPQDKQTKPPKKDEKKGKDKEEPLDKEDDEMIKEGDDQNFNFW